MTNNQIIMAEPDHVSRDKQKQVRTLELGIWRLFGYLVLGNWNFKKSNYKFQDTNKLQ